MTGEWIPLRFREGEALEEDAVLAEGVPAWLRPSLWHWLEDRLLAFGCSKLREFVQHMELRFKCDLGSLNITRADERYWPGIVEIGKTPRSVERLHAALNGDDDLFLEAVDQALYLFTSDVTAFDQVRGRLVVDDLSRILDQGGSIWSVMWPFPQPAYLARRATKVTQQQAVKMASGHGRPGEHLAEAWQHVFGRHPNPGSGYREAVRAVEAAAKPVVLPRDQGATLGKIHPALRDGWKNFVVELGGSDLGQQERACVVADMMRLLWKGQIDRHGTDDVDVPLAVSQEQAEAATHMALFLVEWFQTGAVRRAEEAQDDDRVSTTRRDSK